MKSIIVTIQEALVKKHIPADWKNDNNTITINIKDIVEKLVDKKILVPRKLFPYAVIKIDDNNIYITNHSLIINITNKFYIEYDYKIKIEEYINSKFNDDNNKIVFGFNFSDKKYFNDIKKIADNYNISQVTQVNNYVTVEIDKKEKAYNFINSLPELL